MWLQDKGEQSRIVNLPTHYAGGKFKLSEGPFTHRFANIDIKDIRFFTIDHKTCVARNPVPTPLTSDNILNSELFTIRMLNLAPLSSMKITHKGTAILLNLADIPLNTSKESQFEYWTRNDRDEPVQVHNLSKDTIPCAVFEIY